MALDVTDRHPATRDFVKYFAYSHLQPKQQAIVMPISDLIGVLLPLIPDSAETSAGLRKLLEAKDCFVRASL